MIKQTSADDGSCVMTGNSDPEFWAKARAHLVRYGGAFSPPITIEAGDIDLGLEMFDRALARAVH
jgi:hypothetical protein